MKFLNIAQTQESSNDWIIHKSCKTANPKGTIPFSEVCSLARSEMRMPARARPHYVSLPPDQKIFWPEYENSCIFRASCHKDVLVFMLFYHRKKNPKLGCQSGEIEGGAQVGTLIGLLRLRYGR